jgi:hypothetical protein
MAGKHRGEPADESRGMVAILDGLLATVDAAISRARERGDDDTRSNFSQSEAALRGARFWMCRALDTTNGENDGTDER